MKTIACSFAIIVLVASVTTARAQDMVQNSDLAQNIYVTGDAGAVFQQVARDYDQLNSVNGSTESATFKPGFRVDVAAGYNFSESVAAELQIGYMRNALNKVGGITLSSPTGESAAFNSVPLLANVIYKVPTGNSWVPWLGVGVGGNISILQFSEGGSSATDTDVEPAVQAEAGLNYTLSSNASIGISYKFLATLNQHYYTQTPYMDDHVTLEGIYIHGIFATFTLSF